LRTINAAKLAIFVSPFIPDRDAVLVQVASVGVTAQKPKQLVDDRFDVQLFRCEQREARPVGAQIKSCLCAKHRQRSCACAIGAVTTVLKHEPEKIVILSHA
jgi:hypothetical protein